MTIYCPAPARAAPGVPRLLQPTRSMTSLVIGQWIRDVSVSGSDTHLQSLIRLRPTLGPVYPYLSVYVSGVRPLFSDIHALMI